MQLQLRFFARIREALNTDRLTLSVADGNWTPAAIAQHLADEHGEPWRRELLRPNTLIAVNHETVDADQPLADGDELAFFPPVTGG